MEEKSPCRIGKTDDTTRLIRYPGGKGGLYRNLINLIPPHDTYIETHLGGGAVMRNKLPASINIGIDIDPAVCKMWHDNWPLDPHLTTVFYKRDAVDFLKAPFHTFDGHTIIYADDGHTFIYADPPYLNCKSRCRYKFGYTRKQHIELLECLLRLSSPLVNIMISGYWSELYAAKLDGWYTKSFQAMTRGGMATEYVWMNYAPPDHLHDYRYLGDTFRDRERIIRRQSRWIANFKRMPVLERRALINKINELE